MYVHHTHSVCVYYITLRSCLCVLGCKLAIDLCVSMYCPTHCRALATITYRSAPEWEGRFTERRQPDQDPNFCPDFEVEHYLEAAGDKFCTSYDPNSLLYITKVSTTVSRMLCAFDACF